MTSSTPPSSAAPPDPTLTTTAAGSVQEIQALEPLARAAWRMMTAVAEVLQPVIDQVAATLAHPDTQARLRILAIDGAAFVKRVEEFPSPGYAPYFANMGEEAFSSQFHAYLVWYYGRLQHQEWLDRKEGLVAIRRLARRKRWHTFVAREAECLWRVTHTAIPDWFKTAGKEALQGEFIALLEEARAGVSDHCDRLFAMASEIVHVVPTAKGPKPRFETSLHAMFLDTSEAVGGGKGYTYANLESDYTDKATLATRAELGRPWFSPAAGRQALTRDRARAAAS